jgi:type IV pilus assembly protein PilN
MAIKINLLPHREEKRKQREKGFYALLVLGAIAGIFIIVIVGGILEALIARQDQRNTALKQENQRLDVQIKEISTLKQEIDSLKARQQAVEDLQADRNQPVYLMDELVLQTPEGIYLKSLKQDGQRVVLAGYAQSNERVSEFLRNLGNNSPWLEKPDLIEIKSVTLGQGRDMKKVFDFTVNVGIKRPRDKDAADAVTAGAVGKAGVPPAIAPPTGAKPAASAPPAVSPAASAVSAGTAKR